MPVRKWIGPMVLVSVFIFVLSLRQLSDPDLGFHLKYGRWIVANHCVPATDQSTYTVSQHPYIDLQWLFQVMLYGMFTLTGYAGISLFVCLLSLLLSLLLLLRQRSSGIPPSIIITAMFATFLMIEPRIAPRPEMVTFLFLTGILFILDRYFETRKNLLCLLPVIMLLWCNMHALFILGVIVMGVYFISILYRDRKPDKPLLAWMIVSCLVCFINPYGIKGFVFPVELLTRFDPNNIFNQHIQEFMPFFAQPHFVMRDYLFMALLGVSLPGMFLSFKRRRLHEIMLLILFGFLAVGSIRNIPLFVLVAIPVIGDNAVLLTGKTRMARKGPGLALFALMIILPLAFIPRLLTNAFYTENNSFNRTGMGINRQHRPVQAATFLLDHHLNGRILNSIGFGGWLSWVLPQPVFMDGRLEVMQESIYRKVTQSWNGGLAGLIGEYQPQLIVYNYANYYPWTRQLKEMNDWRLIYADGTAAIFASSGYAREIPELDLSTLPAIDIRGVKRTFHDWLQGFYRPTDDEADVRNHLALFRSQMTLPGQGNGNTAKAAGFFNSANLKYHNGDIRGAMADYDTAIMLQPGYAKAFNNRGILRASSLKDYTGAIADFTRAAAINPGYGDAYLGRGTVYFFMKDLPAARSDWEKARALGNVQAARLLGLHATR